MASRPPRDPLESMLEGREGEEAFLLGNEAVVRGALEAGVGFACGYPGTPSTEISEGFAALASRAELEFQYSVNEKIALESAFGASLAGTRALVAMKHLGLMAAGDPLVTIPYVGVRGGLVIVSAGDPSCLTSPNEQDQRQIAPMLHIPMLDPGTPQEALEMTRFAFELSEESRLPVILRPTTRVCHSRELVRLGARADVRKGGFRRDPKALVPIPGNARRMRVEIESRLEAAAGLLERSGFFSVRGRGSRAIVAAGVPAAVCRALFEEGEAFEEHRLLVLGGVHPLPEKWLLEALAGVERLLVVEELLPFLEDALHVLAHRHGLSIEIRGKRSGDFEDRFEYEEAGIRRVVSSFLGLEEEPQPENLEEDVPPRPPVLCASCPHRTTFFAARAALGDEMLFFNDIGCYTLGYGPPLESADALLAMGSSFPMAAAVARRTGAKTVAFMGDGTFLHSGMPALLDAIKEDADLVAVIMDNQVTAMTGFQESASARIERGRLAQRVDLEALCRALGAKQVAKVDPEDLPRTIAAIREAGRRKGLSVVICERPCIVFTRRHGIEDEHPLAEGGVAVEGGRGERPITYRVDLGLCGHCGREGDNLRCGQGVHRPFERAITTARAVEEDKGGPLPQLAPCATACPIRLCIQGYSAHIAGGDFARAYELIRERLPLPESICRVCHRPCEEACVRAGKDGAVASNDLKRFVVDRAAREGFREAGPRPAEANGLRVAVVGAGPAGLAAAHDLALRGYAVDLFDAEEHAGGLLRYGIPRYRLPSEALDRDLEGIFALGVRFHGGRRLGADLSIGELAAEHEAVLLALGGGAPRRLDLPGEGPEVRDALGFLRERKEGGGSLEVPVCVIGGGNAAIDASRVALRLGAPEVRILCLEDETEMPAIREEIAEALAEGVEILTRTLAVRLEEGGLRVADARRKESGPFDPADFEPVAGSERVLPAGLVLLALGQTGEGEGCGGEGRAERRVSPSFTPGAVQGVHVEARGSVVEAIAEGQRAAFRVDRRLRGEEAPAAPVPPPQGAELPPAGVRGNARRAALESRIEVALRAPEFRVRDFDEIRAVYTEDEARREASRCMICGQCGNCRSCLELFGCPAFVLEEDGIRIDDDLCVACGVCAAFCPNQAIRPVYAVEGPA